MKNLTLPADSRNAKSRKGHDRSLSILVAARDLIVAEGFHNITMRKVAAGCNITVGNLSYYYPSKESLIHELVASILNGYEEVWLHIINDDNLTPSQKLADFTGLIIEDLYTYETTRFFPELWVMAAHDPVVCAAMDGVYSKVRAVFQLLIAQVNPSLKEEAVITLSIFMSASIEGHTVFIGNGKPCRSYAPNILKLAKNAFVEIAKSATNESVIC